MEADERMRGLDPVPTWLADDGTEDELVLDELLSALDALYETEQRLKQIKAQTRSLIERALVALDLREAESETHKVLLQKSMKVSVPRAHSEQVYQLLLNKGFDCFIPSSVKRKLAIEILMGENEGQLPPDLAGLVEAQLVDTLIIKRK